MIPIAVASSYSSVHETGWASNGECAVFVLPISGLACAVDSLRLFNRSHSANFSALVGSFPNVPRIF